MACVTPAWSSRGQTLNKLALLLLSILLFEGYTWLVTLSSVLRLFVSLFDITRKLTLYLNQAHVQFFQLFQGCNILLVTFRVKNIVSFCVKKLLHFGSMLHFASKVITFRVNVTFCGVTGVRQVWLSAENVLFWSEYERASQLVMGNVCSVIDRWSIVLPRFLLTGERLWTYPIIASSDFRFDCYFLALDVEDIVDDMI